MPYHFNAGHMGAGLLVLAVIKKSRLSLQEELKNVEIKTI